MVGERASVWRAVLMTEILFFIKLLRRQASVMNVASFAFLVMIIVNPNYIFEAGFILSYVCVFSLLIIMPIFEYYIKRTAKKIKSNVLNKVYYYFFSGISVSLSVFLGVFPLLAYYFNMIAPAFVIANFFAIPLCFLIITASILSMLLPFTGAFFFKIITACSTVLVSSLSFTEEILQVYKVGKFPISYIFLYYLCLGVAIFMFKEQVRTKA